MSENRCQAANASCLINISMAIAMTFFYTAEIKHFIRTYLAESDLVKLKVQLCNWCHVLIK